MNPEELRKRRELRQKKYAQQKARQRKLLLRLGIAAVILVVCVAVIISACRKPKSTGENPTQPTQTQTISLDEMSQQILSPEEGETTTVNLAVAGDLNVTDRVVASGGDTYDYTGTFLDVLPALADADLTVLNFEGNLLGSPYGGKTASAPQQLLEALGRAGVDMIQLANSYSIHNGISGLQSTIAASYSAGIEPLGAYADQNAYRAGKGYTIREVRGIKIAFVAFTKGMDGMALPPGSENCVNVLYTDYDSTYQTIDRDGIIEILQNVEKEKPDITVALLHWGSEFNNTISESQEKIAQLMQANGVDAIIGTHSHYVQQVKYDPETGSFIAYSLGDFCGDGERAGSEYSVVLNLEITRDNKEKITKITGWDYTPVFVVNEADQPLRVVRLNEGIRAYEEGFLDRVTKPTYDKMVYAKERIEKRLAGE